MNKQIKLTLLTFLMVFVSMGSIVKAQVTVDDNTINVKGKDYEIAVAIEKAQEGAKIPVAIAATGRNKGKYLSHASNKVTLQDGAQGSGELFIIEKKFNRRVALACVGGESGKYLSHAFGKVSLQNGYQGKGEEWLLIPVSRNKIKLVATGDEEGWLLSSKTKYKGEVYLMDKTTGESEYWIIESKDEASSSGIQDAAIAGFTLCTSEGQTCDFNRPVDVAYGANGKFIVKNNVTGKVTFSNDYFGNDPIAGVAKSGYYKYTGPTPDISAYTKCASEGGVRFFPKPVDVAFGAEGKYVFKNNVTGRVIFSPEFFGFDPIFGVGKSGYSKDSE